MASAALIAPNTSSNWKEAFVKAAQDTYETLDMQKDLSPKNPAVNACLSAFVGAVLNVSKHPHAKDVIEDPQIKALRPKLLTFLSKAEYEMEKHFAELFAARPSLKEQDLKDFWYRNCYHQLIAEELKVLRQTETSPDKPVAFVGSGPLPLTAIDFNLQSGRKVTCIDSNTDAVRLSRSMISNMGLSDKINIVHTEGASANYKEFGMVMIASLIPQKENVLARIRETAPEAIVAVRSVEGAKAMLYEEVDPKDFEKAGLTLVSSTRDTSSTINTTLYFKPAP